MKRVDFLQGSPEWHAHRLQHFNASDAPAMLGCSPYTSRAELLRRLHTGIAPEVDAGTQRRYDDGHRFEALARPIQEEIIGDDLAPVVGTEGELSASFDALTFMADQAGEHKALNDDIRASLPHAGRDSHERNEAVKLSKHYRTQMEQQLLVSGAKRVLFSATKWNDDSELIEERHAWYYPDPALRAEIVAGWRQFAEDLANYKAPAAVEKIVAEPVEALPAPVVQVTGQIALQDNFKVFEQRLRLFLSERLIREPKTDQDFADLDVQIKAMKQAREALKAAEAQMLAQVQPVDQAKKTKDMLDDLLQKNVSMAEKLLKDEKERRRGEIVAGGVKALADHVAALNVRLGKAYMPSVPADFGGCIKGMKSLASMEDKVATELARAKIAANEVADRIDANLRHLREHAKDYAHLFPDTAAIVQKAPDDLQALVTSRIAEHRAAEERRLEAERSRIRAEEQERADREARERAAAEQRQRETQEAAAAQQQAAHDRINDEGARRLLADAAKLATTVPTANVHPLPTKAPAAPASPPTLRLGQINALIAPLSIDAAGLAALGFPPAATDKNAKLYHSADFPRMRAAMVAHLQAVQLQEAA